MRSEHTYTHAALVWLGSNDECKSDFKFQYVRLLVTLAVPFNLYSNLAYILYERLFRCAIVFTSRFQTIRAWDSTYKRLIENYTVRSESSLLHLDFAKTLIKIHTVSCFRCFSHFHSHFIRLFWINSLNSHFICAIFA